MPDIETALQRLRQKEVRLAAELGDLQQKLRKDVKLSSDIRHRSDPTDMAGVAFASSELSARLKQAGQLERALNEVRRVKIGLESGAFVDEYGYCQGIGCGMEIPERRLEIHPEATLCVECKSAEERMAKKNSLHQNNSPTSRYF